MNDSPSYTKKKRNWVASPPNGEITKYKMFPSVLSRCSMGSLETCTHIISRSKTYSLFISIAETYYYYYYYYYYYIIIMINIIIIINYYYYYYLLLFTCDLGEIL